MRGGHVAREGDTVALLRRALVAVALGLAFGVPSAFTRFSDAPVQQACPSAGDMTISAGCRHH